MDDDVDNLRKASHQSILDDVRQRMGCAERRLRIDPEVQVDEHVTGGTACPDFFATDHARNRFDHRSDVILGDYDLIREHA